MGWQYGFSLGVIALFINHLINRYEVILMCSLYGMSLSWRSFNHLGKDD